jgi:hypothetical protein
LIFFFLNFLRYKDEQLPFGCLRTIVTTPGEWTPITRSERYLRPGVSAEQVREAKRVLLTEDGGGEFSDDQRAQARMTLLASGEALGDDDEDAAAFGNEVLSDREDGEAEAEAGAGEGEGGEANSSRETVKEVVRSSDCRIRLYAFDLPVLHGRDVCALPYLQRQALLAHYIRAPARGLVLCSQFLIHGNTVTAAEAEAARLLGPQAHPLPPRSADREKHLAAMLLAAIHRRNEGLVFKRIDSPYRLFRDESWVKLKHDIIGGGPTIEAVLVGLSKSSRKDNAEPDKLVLGTRHHTSHHLLSLSPSPSPSPPQASPRPATAARTTSS